MTYQGRVKRDATARRIDLCNGLVIIGFDVLNLAKEAYITTHAVCWTMREFKNLDCARYANR